MSFFSNIFDVSNYFKREKLNEFFVFPNIRLGRTEANIIKASAIAEKYNSIPELRCVIDYKASMLANAYFEVLNKKNEVIENHPILALLNKPNPLQSKNEFLMSYSVAKDVYGNAFINKNQVSKNGIKALWVLPSAFMEIETSGKMFDQIEKNKIISGYKLKVNGVEKTFKTEDVLMRTSGSIHGAVEGDSKLEALRLPISNIEASYRSRNIIIEERGAIGILTGHGMGEFGDMGLDDVEKAAIQESYKRKYGLNKNQDHIIISNTPLNWQSMSFPTKDLMLLEEVQEDFLRIVDAFGLNIHLFSRNQSATYENVSQGLKSAYQNTIIPEAKDLAEDLTDFLGLSEQGLRLNVSFSHLPILQENEKEKSDIMTSKIDNIIKLVSADLISNDEAKKIIKDERLFDDTI